METRFFTLPSQNVAVQIVFCINVKSHWQFDPAHPASLFLPVSPPTKKTNTAWKVSKYGIFSGPYFPEFRMNTESESGKIQTRKNSVFGHFLHSAIHRKQLSGNIYAKKILEVISCRIYPSVSSKPNLCVFDNITNANMATYIRSVISQIKKNVTFGRRDEKQKLSHK